MDPDIQEVADKIKALKERMAELDNEFRGKPFTGEIKAEWNANTAEVEELERLKDELVARKETIQANAENAEAIERPSFSINIPRADRDVYDMSAIRSESRDENHMRDLMRENALRSVERMTPNSRANKEDAQAEAQRLLETDGSGEIARRFLATGSPTYRRAWNKYVAQVEMTNEERTALSTTAGAGGYAVPYMLDPTVILTNNGTVNPWRNICRNIQITGETWKGVASSGVTAAYLSEATEESDHSPTFTQPSVTVGKGSAFVPYSIEIEQDWGGLGAELATMVADAKNILESQAFTTGTGTAPQPLGILGVGFTGGITTAVRTQTATTATFVVADVYSMEGALAPRFRQNASIVGNRATYNAIRQFDTAGGASLFVNNLQLGIVNKNDGVLSQSLLGYNTYESSVMASTPTTTGAKTLIIGDFSNFAIVDRIGLNVEVAPMLFGGSSRYPTGQRGLLAYWRNATVVLNASAFNYLEVK